MIQNTVGFRLLSILSNNTESFNMKIALIIERADIELGGAERSLFELSSALRSTGCQVEILCAKGNKKIKNVHPLCSEL